MAARRVTGGICPARRSPPVDSQWRCLGGTAHLGDDFRHLGAGRCHGLVHCALLATTCFCDPWPVPVLVDPSGTRTTTRAPRIVSGSSTRRRANSASARPRTSAFAKASDELFKLKLRKIVEPDRRGVFVAAALGRLLGRVGGGAHGVGGPACRC